MRLAFLPVLLALLLQGCGTKGPLYLPPPATKAPETQTAPKQPQQEKSQ